MNGYMRIQVEVLAARARKELAALNAQMNAMQGATTRAGMAIGPGSPQQQARLVKYGNQLQWTGRQLFRNFAVPLIAAGAIGMKFALDQEKAMVHVRKVYGDAAATEAYYHTKGIQGKQAETRVTAQFTKELEHLDTAFTSLSETYAIQKKEVIEVAGAWAAAGVSGVELARSVENTLRASAIGDMSTIKAGEALISIQSQYNLSSKELTDTLDMLNAVENATATNMQDLIVGFQRAAGVANQYGVDTRHLAADIAALVPAAGTAANAGNALKTILSRLMAPTTAATKAFKSMGLEVDGKAWRNSSAQDRLLAFADAYNDLSKNARGAIGAVVFGRYQVSRSEIIMADATRTHGYYNKALNATKTQSQAFNTAQRELNAILDSQPKKLARVGIVLQNSLADIMVPLIPYIISLAHGVANLVKGFQTLPGWVQKLALYLGLFLILMPLITMYLGSMATLFGVLGSAMAWVAGIASGVIAAIFSPIGLAVVAAIAALILFRDQFVELFHNIAGFLVGSDNPIAVGFRAVVDTAIDAFNSLPEGIQGALIATVMTVREAALQVYEWFSYLNPWAHHSPSLVENVRTGMKAVITEFSTMSQIQGYVMGAYKVLKMFGVATASFMKRARGVEEASDRATIKKGAGVGAVKLYDQLIGKLHVLTSVYDKLGQRIANAEAKIAGPMAAADEAIWQNNYAQKKLQMEILKTEKAYGSFDDMKSKIEALNGEVELLRGTQQDLRNAGAGSDILNAYDDQIAALRGQQQPIVDNINKIDQLKKQLQDLQDAGNILDLQKSLDFDPALHAIDKMREKYNLVGDAIDQIKSKIGQITSASVTVASGRKSLKGSGAGAAADMSGDFPDVGGSGLPGRTSGKKFDKNGLPKSDFLGDQSKMIDDYVKEMQTRMGDTFSKINPFKPIISKAKSTFESIRNKIPDWTFSGDSLSGFADKAGKVLSGIGRFLKPEFKAIGEAISENIGPVVDDISRALKQSMPVIRPVLKALGSLAVIVGGVLVVAFKILLDILGAVLGPVLRGVGLIIAGVINLISGIARTVAGVVNLIVAIFTGDWAGAWEAAKDIVAGAAQAIAGVFQILAGVVRGILGSIIKLIIGLFKWGFKTALIYPKWFWGKVVDLFSLGWSGIKKALGWLKGIGSWIWDNALKPAYDKFKDLFVKVGNFFKKSANLIKDPFKAVMNFVIRGVNKMTSGLNKVSEILPGIPNFGIKPIQELAQGGHIPNRRVGNGWVTNGARAIVGEGKANHPEFVVPTDPTYRSRAVGLFKQLGQRLGVLDANNKAVMDMPARNHQGVPMYGIGGMLDGIKDKAGNALSAAGGGIKKAAKGVKNLAQNAASLAYKPFGWAVDKLIDQIGWKYGREPVKSGHKVVRQWIKGADSYSNKVAKEAGGKWKKPLNGGYSIGGGIGSYKGHNGQDFPVPTGTKVHAITSGKVTRSTDIIKNGKLASYGKVIELSHSGGWKSLYAHNSSRLVKTGQSITPGQVIARSGSTGNSSGSHLHLSIWKNGKLKSPLEALRSHGVMMGDGGIVMPRVGGTLATLGERGQREAVVPLPAGFNAGNLGGGNTYNVTVYAEFPNVTDGSDAEDFLNNLESVVKD